MRRCCTCKIEKDETEFGVDKQTLSGLSRRCKKCCCQRTKDIRIKNPEKIKEYDRQRYVKRAEKLKEYRKRPEFRARERERQRKLKIEDPEINRKRRDKYIDKIRLGEKERYKKNPNKYKSRLKDYKKYKVRSQLNNAVKLGKIIRPESCERCKKECKPHGHHENYDKPFEVIWLCPMCHKKEHTILN